MPPKQNYRVISNLLFKVSVFLNFAHKFQCWVELCLLFIFGESVTIEIENLKKKSPFFPLPWFSGFCPTCSVYASSLFPCSSFLCFLHYLFLFLFFLTHWLYYSYHFKESHKLSFKNFIDLFKVLPWSYSVITKSLSLDTYIFCYSVSKSRPALCNPMDCSTPGFSVLHYLPEFAQTHI